VILSRAAAGLACLAIAFSGSGLALEPPLSAHAAAQAPAPFSFNWTEKPTSPMPWNPTNWDVIVHSRDQQTWSQLDPVQAQHGSDCGAPPATHVVTSYEDAVFVCNQHMMTAINARGYGEIMFTPDHLADWTNQPVVIDWQQSTLRTSARDWTDVTVTPFLDNLVLPAHTGVDLLGRPRNAINIEMLASVPTTFVGTVISDFNAQALSGSAPALEQVLPESARVRTHYQLEISRTHIRFGLPDQNVWWIDSPLPDLGYTTGLVQWGHHSYSPDKECQPTPGVLSCTGDTWHWSNFSISPAIPFTMLRGTLQQHVSHDTAKTVEFGALAPAGSYLRFAAMGQISVSFDHGATWNPAHPQASEKNPDGVYRNAVFDSYFVPVPRGTKDVVFSGQDTYFSWWWVKDAAIWSLAPLEPGATAGIGSRQGAPASPSAPVAPAQSIASANQDPLVAAQSLIRRWVGKAYRTVGLDGADLTVAALFGIAGLVLGLLMARRRRGIRPH
jgi:hypothetical protein